MHYVSRHIVSLTLWVQTQLDKETQLRQELEDRLSKESSLTDRLSKEVAAAKVLMSFAWLFTSFSLPFSELSLVESALDLVDQPSSFSAMTLLVVSSDS